LFTFKPTVNPVEIAWLNYKAPVPCRFGVFAFMISKRNMQFALIADFGKKSNAGNLSILGQS
jgi:hypothetical protein